MKDKKEELKQLLIKEAETTINRMLEEAGSRKNLTLTDIERLARQAGEQVMVDITQTLVSAEAQQKEAPMCSGCGQKMRNKGLKAKHIITETGELRIERHYYYCETCRTGVFPPGSTDEVG